MATAYVQPVDQNGQPIVQQPVVVQQGMVMQQPPQQQQQQQYVQQAQPQMQQMERAQVVAVGAHPDWAKYQGRPEWENLRNVQSAEFKQGNVFWEAVSGGCAANSYMLSDRVNLNPHGKFTPIFIMSEESSCWCRLCCGPNQPAFIKMYNVSNGGEAPPAKCCGCTWAEGYTRYNKEGTAALTLEKPGCGQNMAQCGSTNCFVCLACCQSEVFMHEGEVNSVYDPQGCGPCCKAVPHWTFPQGGPGYATKASMFSHAQVPICGGGITPTVNLMLRTGGPDGLGDGPAPESFATVTGPTCFGGCMDLCCTTKFMVTSKNASSKGDLAMITKKTPSGCWGWCTQLWTIADTYHLDFNMDALIDGQPMSPKQKAAIVGEMVHLDYLFFEADQPLCRNDESAKMCHILLCTCYCLGCLCPCELCIPYGQPGEGGGE